MITIKLAAREAEHIARVVHALSPDVVMLYNRAEALRQAVQADVNRPLDRIVATAGGGARNARQKATYSSALGTVNAADEVAKINHFLAC